MLALIGYGGWYWISGPTTPNATAESELAVVEIDNKQLGLMEKNAIRQESETVSQTTPGTTLGDQDAPVIIAEDDVAQKISPANTENDNDGMEAGVVL